MIRPILLLFLSLTLGAVAQTVTPANGKFPALMVQVTVGTQQRRDGGISYRKSMTISPKFTIDGTSRMLPIPEAEAVMLIITMDTRAKYVNNDESYKVLIAETLPIPAVQNGTRRSFAFGESQVSFDSYRDASNVGGDTYKYYVFGLRDPATKTILDFKTNNPPLQALIKANPDKREEFLNYKTGQKFPSTFK